MTSPSACVDAPSANINCIEKERERETGGRAWNKESDVVLFHNPPSMTMGAIGAGAIYMSVDMSKSFAIERGERRRWRHRDITICNLPSIARDSHRRCQESRHQRHHSRKRSLTLSLYIYIYI